MTPSLTIEGIRELLLLCASLALADQMNRAAGSPPAVGSVELQAAIKQALETPSCAAAQPKPCDLPSCRCGGIVRPNSPTLTSTEAADLLGISRSTVNRNAAKYRAIRCGIKWLFPADYIYDLIGVDEID